MKLVPSSGAARLGRATAWVLGWAGLLGGVASAAQFESPPLIGDRRVALSWQPDPDDPVFNGNAVLEVRENYPFIHGVGRRVVQILPTSVVREAFSYASGESAITRWRLSDGQVVATLPLGSSSEPVDFSIHGSNRFLLGAHANGDVELWDTVRRTSEFFQASTQPLRRVAFVPGITDTNVVRFAVAGESNRVHLFEAPGRVLYSMNVPDGPTEALAINRRGTRLVTGGVGRRIRVWDITTTPNAPLPFFVVHPATIREVVIEPRGNRMASVDETGHVIISRVETGTVLAEFDVDVSQGLPRIDFSVPDGNVLSVALASGVLQLYDGNDGRFFREARVSDDRLTAYAVGPLGERNIVGDANGRIRLIRAGRCVPSLENPVCFGGYKIWRNTVPDSSGALLLRVFGFGDSTWSFAGRTREFADPDSLIARVAPPNEGDPTDEIRIAGPHNGVPYFYSITRFDRYFLNGAIFDVNVNPIPEGFYRDPGETVPTAIVPTPDARSDLPLLGQVYVVPNPYEAGNVPWDAIGGEHVEFRNLPGSARIRILSVAGDLIRILEHGPDRYGESRSAALWDLRNSAGERVTSGVYIYQIETPSAEVIQGYFIVVL